MVDWNKRDRYRRVVGKVLLDRRDVNLEQVKRGMVWHYKAYPLRRVFYACYLPHRTQR